MLQSVNSSFKVTTLSLFENRKDKNKMAGLPMLTVVKTHFSANGWLYIQVENGDVILHRERRRAAPQDLAASGLPPDYHGEPRIVEVMEEEEDAAEGRPVDAPASPQPGPSGAGRLQPSTPDSDSEEVPWADYAGESGSDTTVSDVLFNDPATRRVMKVN